MTSDGAAAFEFIYGHWAVANRKIRDVSDPDCDDWVEFSATSKVDVVLGGGGHVDEMHVPDPPDGPAFDGFTLRLYDPTADLWRIWWSSTRNPGHLDPPVVGRFEGSRGTFECDDVIAGLAVRVRFEWNAEDLDLPVWRQSFSRDGGATWKLNWVMSFSRL